MENHHYRKFILATDWAKNGGRRFKIEYRRALPGNSGIRIAPLPHL
jgi:hypothetical protein